MTDTADTRAAGFAAASPSAGSAAAGRPVEGRSAEGLAARGGPTIRVGGLLALEDRILMVQQGRGESRYWLLPGGGVRFGESLAHALMRETHEELGLRVAVGPQTELFGAATQQQVDRRQHEQHDQSERPAGGAPIGAFDQRLQRGQQGF